MTLDFEASHSVRLNHYRFIKDGFYYTSKTKAVRKHIELLQFSGNRTMLLTYQKFISSFKSTSIILLSDFASFITASVNPDFEKST